MSKNIFRVVTDLIDSRDDVLAGNAVNGNGALYDDSVESLNALRMLEPSLHELVTLCVKGGIEWECLEEIIDLIGWDNTAA
jgi:hypothetical protein